MDGAEQRRGTRDPRDRVDPVRREAAIVRVVIVDDSAVFREAAAVVVRSTPGFEQAGLASSGEEAVEIVAATAPDLVLLDIRMPGIGGVEAARRIRDALPDVVVVLVTADSAGQGLDDHSRQVAAAIVDKVSLTPRTLTGLWERHGEAGAG